MKKNIWKILTLVILIGSTTSIKGQSSNDVLAPTPPMGWNSWNHHGKKDINENIVKQTIDAMVSEGLKDAGYKYVVIDGGWRSDHLGPNGELLPHSEKFPNGIKPLVEYAHSKGLKLGIHIVPGTMDCGGDPVGGLGHEEVQMKQFVEWGIDFLKLDKCRYKADEDWNEEVLKETYYKWHDLIKASGREIMLSISAYVYRDWNPEISSMSRTTLDIAARISPGTVSLFYDTKVDNFFSVMQIAEMNNEVADKAKPGFWNDPDMLITGDHGLSYEDQQVHFALWCIMSSPLFLGNDPRNMSPSEKEITLNQKAIEINQDPTEQGKLVIDNGNEEVWVKKMQGGKFALLLLNRSKANASMKVKLEDLGIKGKMQVWDVYKKKVVDSVKTKLSKDVKAESGWFVLLTPKQD